MEGHVAPNPAIPGNNNVNATQTMRVMTMMITMSLLVPRHLLNTCQINRYQINNCKISKCQISSHLISLLHSLPLPILWVRFQLCNLFYKNPFHNSLPQLIPLVPFSHFKLAVTFATSTSPSDNSPTND